MLKRYWIISFFVLFACSQNSFAMVRQDFDDEETSCSTTKSSTTKSLAPPAPDLALEPLLLSDIWLTVFQHLRPEEAMR